MAFSLLPEILVAHPWMGRGESEATAMWTLHALQERVRITFTTASPVDWRELNAIHGTAVRPELVTLLRAPRLPGISAGTTMAHWQRAWFERFCRGASARFDACISTYNPLNFRAPAIHLVADFSFDERCRLAIYPNASDQLQHRPSLMRQAYLAVGQQLAERWGALPYGPEDLVVANSEWTADRLREHFPLTDVPVLRPPVPLRAAADPSHRDPLGFVGVARISPEKEFETIFNVLDRVRAAGRAVTLDVLDRARNAAYSRGIQRLAEERGEWVRMRRFLDPEEKAECFATRSFTLHASEVDAFGSAVAEMAAAGVIPLVPADGACSEIARDPRLHFRDADEGAAKVLALLDDPAARKELRQGLREDVRRFAPEHFSRALVGLVSRFLGRDI